MVGFPASEKQFSSLSPCVLLQLRALGAAANEALPPSPLHLSSLPHARRNRLSLTTQHTSTIATLILGTELHQICSDLAARGTAICTRVSSRPNLHIRLVFS